MHRAIGLMSGTSMDGIDAALLETDGSSVITALGHTSLTYPSEFKILLKAAEYVVRQQGALPATEDQFSQQLSIYLEKELQVPAHLLQEKLDLLSNYLPLRLDDIIRHSTDLHALTVKKLLTLTGFSAQQIDVIGYHGQTLYHQPALKRSIIVGLGQHLADQLQITVIHDFRRRDILHGGQGAPFAPIYHQALARQAQRIPAAVVNCGGIANISFINGDDILDLLAFDTGPGNGLIDRLVRQRSQGREHMDRDGRYGKQGQVNTQILPALYEKAVFQNEHNYFLTPPPKSLDIGDLKLISEMDSLSLQDACATLEAFTADSIVSSLQWLTGEAPRQWILAGGGWNNPVICQEFRSRLENKLGKNIQVLHANEIGWNSQALEAQIFAYFAVRSLQNKPLSAPGTTGVPFPLCGGQAYLPR